MKIEKILDVLNEKRVKTARFSEDGKLIEVNFFEKEQQGMPLDPVSLSKALSDSMPPDSEMLFASADDMILNEDKK